jgi:hypothetical protein
MYNPPHFLTLEVLAEILAERSWPASYTVEDDLPDGIDIVLPRCHLFVSEGFESEMTLKFTAESTRLDRHVSVVEALVALRADPANELPPSPTLINYFSPAASLDKVKNGLRDQLTLLFTYFSSSLVGDFAWVPAYRASRGLAP